MKSALLLLAVIYTVSGNPCPSQLTCRECIETPTCAWCNDPSPNFGDKKRCFQAESNVDSCREEYGFNPVSHLRYIKSSDLSQPRHGSVSDRHGSTLVGSTNVTNSGYTSTPHFAPLSDTSKIVQITPQHANLKLRKGESFRINIHYTRAADSPVDLYQLVEMKDNATSEIKVNYYSTCLNTNGSPEQTNKCENIKLGDLVTFDVEIELTACPKDTNDLKQTFQIHPDGIDESLVVDLDMLCSCPCEQPRQPGCIENA